MPCFNHSSHKLPQWSLPRSEEAWELALFLQVELLGNFPINFPVKAPVAVPLVGVCFTLQNTAFPSGKVILLLTHQHLAWPCDLFWPPIKSERKWGMLLLSRRLKCHHVVSLLPSSMTVFWSEGRAALSEKGQNKDEIEHRYFYAIVCMVRSH